MCGQNDTDYSCSHVEPSSTCEFFVPLDANAPQFQGEAYVDNDKFLVQNDYRSSDPADNCKFLA